MENTKNQNPTQGLKIIITVLAVVVVAVAVLFFVNVNSLKDQNAALTSQKTTLTSDLAKLNKELLTIKSTNESLNSSLEAEKMRVESLLADLEKEKSTSRAKINRLNRDVNHLKMLVKKYAAQIETLKAENAVLTEENLRISEDLKNTTLRAEAAEANAAQLAELVAKGQFIPAREIELINLKGKKDKETKRIKRADKLKIDFTLVANEIAEAGSRTVFARLVGPDGFLLSTNENNKFDFNGNALGFTASREVDYQNKDLMVSVYLDEVNKLPKGEYTVEVYMDGFMIGSEKINAI